MFVRSARFGMVLAVSASFLLVLGACKRPIPEGDACKYDTECVAGHLCFERVCRTEGFVLARGREACRGENACKEAGYCTPELLPYQPAFDEERWKCYVRSHKDCLDSDRCRKDGHCRYDQKLASCQP